MPSQDSELIARLAQRVQALSQTGLTFAKDPYDIERYKELREIAAKLMALGEPPSIILTAFEAQIGYATPKVDVRAAVIREGKILMTREAEDGLWSLPGGWADVGDPPSQAAEREVREEAGLEVKAMRLLGVWDRNLHGHPPHAFHIYKMIFLCRELGGELRTSTESLELGFFGIDELPPLSTTRIVPAQIRFCLEAADDHSRATYFD